MNMTINQALEKLTNKKSLNERQQKLRDSLIRVKIEFGGNTLIENTQYVKDIIE